MNTVFCTQESDKRGVRAVEVLHDLGYPTEILTGDRGADQRWVAIFTPSPINQDPYLLMARIVRINCAKLLGKAPSWAQETPFLFAINRDLPETVCIRHAMEHSARRLVNWHPGDRLVPWGEWKQLAEIPMPLRCRIVGWRYWALQVL